MVKVVARKSMMIIENGIMKILSRMKYVKRFVKQNIRVPIVTELAILIMSEVPVYLMIPAYVRPT